VCAGGQPGERDVIWVPAENRDDVPDPLACEPLVFKAVVSVEVVCGARKVAEDGEAVSDVDPYLFPLFAHVLSLAGQAVRRTKLKKSAKTVKGGVVSDAVNLPAVDVDLYRKSGARWK
jgi:hypothetical protein